MKLPRILRLITDYQHMDVVYKEGTIFTREKDGMYHSNEYPNEYFSGNIFSLNPTIWEPSLSNDHVILLKKIDKKLDKLLKDSKKT